MSSDASLSEQQDFVMDPGWDREPVQCAQNGGYVFVFSDYGQDPGSAVLEV